MLTFLHQPSVEMEMLTDSCPKELVQPKMIFFSSFTHPYVFKDKTFIHLQNTNKNIFNEIWEIYLPPFKVNEDSSRASQEHVRLPYLMCFYIVFTNLMKCQWNGQKFLKLSLKISSFVFRR